MQIKSLWEYFFYKEFLNLIVDIKVLPLARFNYIFKFIWDFFKDLIEIVYL